MHENEVPIRCATKFMNTESVKTDTTVALLWRELLARLSSHGYWLPDLGYLPCSWQGSVKVEYSQLVAAVGKQYIGGDMASYDGFTEGILTTYVPMLF